MAENIDNVQYHILGVIHTLMKSYNLTIDQVDKHHSYVLACPPESIINDYATMCQLQASSASESMVDSEQTDSEMSHSDCDEDRPVYVSSRREFCNAMGKGIKICPRYSSCQNQKCKHFHIQKQYICPHVTRGAYCDAPNCELIVIRPCKRGRKCNDADCSFRH